jgi:carboxyl-terminal processing protease
LKLKSIYNKWTYIQSITTQKEEKANEEIADSVLFLLKENYINKDQLSWTNSIDSNNLSEFINTLWEEYTVYYNSDEWKKFMDSLNWEFAWIWVYLIQKWLNNPIISEVIADSPADKAWLQAEDIILSIDWKTILDFKSSDEFIDALKWDKDTTVKVQVKRWYSVLTKEIIRDNIHLPTVDSVKVWDMCYVRLYSFDIWAYKKFMDEMKGLWECSKYVFDIRSNPWGVIEEVVNVLDEFVPEWKTIFTQKWVETTEIIKSNNKPSLSIKDPTVILIDWYTASAAEIFAWVMKYYFPNEVKLVWSQSYGKWSVQQVVQFPNNSIIKYTIWIWYIADNEVSIDKVWLKPDITVIDNPYTQKDEVLELIGLKSN